MGFFSALLFYAMFNVKFVTFINMLLFHKIIFNHIYFDDDDDDDDDDVLLSSTSFQYMILYSCYILLVYY